jgi:hypothetical protein
VSLFRAVTSSPSNKPRQINCRTIQALVNLRLPRLCRLSYFRLSFAAVSWFAA